MSLLDNLLDDAFDILYIQNLGLNHADHIFRSVLELLRQDGSAREEFFDRVKHQMAYPLQIEAEPVSRPSSFVDYDLILYIAHTTQWDEFNDVIKIRLESESYKTSSKLSEDIADYIKAALKDDWDDKDYYPSLSPSLY